MTLLKHQIETTFLVPQLPTTFALQLIPNFYDWMLPLQQDKIKVYVMGLPWWSSG